MKSETIVIIELFGRHANTVLVIIDYSIFHVTEVIRFINALSG